MDELKQIALKLFEIEKNLLLREKHEYSCAIVIVVTPEGHYYEEAEFDDETEMDTVYGAVVERARSKNAIAIITINSAREKDVKDEGELGSYRWGQLAEEDQPRCLFLTISGPGIKPLSVTLPFSLKNAR